MQPSVLMMCLAGSALCAVFSAVFDVHASPDTEQAEPSQAPSPSPPVPVPPDAGLPIPRVDAGTGLDGGAPPPRRATD